MLMIILSTLLFLTTNQATVTTDPIEYKLLATSRTSTMEKELNGVGRDDFVFCGITVAETSFGGREVVSILRRQTNKK